MISFESIVSYSNVSKPLVNSINGLTSKKEEVMLSALAIDTEANAKRRQRHLKVTQTSLTLAILH
jgi:hypothetical protein